MQIEWSDAKNHANIRKHGIGFADIGRVFEGPMLVGLDTREDYGEDRWIGIGLLDNVLVVVAFTELDEDRIRMISARKATRREAESYQERFRY